MENSYIREIITDLSKINNRAKEIDIRKNNNEVRETILELKETLRQYDKGVALSAPQIGKDYRIFVINFKGDYRTFINPIITQVKGMTINRENSLSIPNKEFLIPRYGQIEVMYQTPLGKSESKKLIGLAAYIFQQQLDHLEGINISDIGLEIDDDFDKATDEEREQIVEMFLKSLDLKYKELEKEIEEDEDLKKTKDAIDFMTKVQRGEVEIEVEQVDDKVNNEIADKVANALKNEDN